MMHGLRATLYAIMLQLVLVQSQKCEEVKPKIGQNGLEHHESCIPMAMRHSDDLVGPYRIFRPIDTNASYHSLEVRGVR